MLSRLFSRSANTEERRIRAWCRKTFGLTPRNLPLVRQALRHSSAVPDDRPDLPDNERLEFLGDAVLDAVVGQFLFNTYPEKGEGFLTRMRSKLVSRHQLSILAKHVQIEQVMESNIGRSHETAVPGNALEALIGALFLDRGFDRTNKAVLALMHEHLDLKAIEQEDRDNKSRLLEWGQKKRRKVEFRVVEEPSRGGRGKNYLAEVLVDGEVRGTGKGASKKKAEQDAAQAAFRSVRPHSDRHDRGGHGGEGRGPKRSSRDRDRKGSSRALPRNTDPRALPPHPTEGGDQARAEA
ncbi:MAG TPA: ribonuclease III [Flavobacteriales bacterium]|nr:ribonuclease III [Flavobacteriales bacterium]